MNTEMRATDVRRARPPSPAPALSRAARGARGQWRARHRRPTRAQVRPRNQMLFLKQKTAYEIGLGIPAEPLFRSDAGLGERDRDRELGSIGAEPRGPHRRP